MAKPFTIRRVDATLARFLLKRFVLQVKYVSYIGPWTNFDYVGPWTTTAATALARQSK